jgi:predicted flavoprotein YhiN
MKRNWIPCSRVQQNKHKLCQGTQQSPHKTLKEEILQVIPENFIQMLLEMVNQNKQEALKKFQDNKNKEYEKAQKQINELVGALNKHQSERENTINREIN